MSSLQTFLPLTSLLNLIFSGPTLTPALQICFPYLELPYCTIKNDLAMDFGLSATGQNTCCTQFRNRRHVASWGEGGGGRGVTFWACHINGGGGNFLKYPLPGRGKFFICLNCLKITDPPLGINNKQSPREFHWSLLTSLTKGECWYQLCNSPFRTGIVHCDTEFAHSLGSHLV